VRGTRSFALRGRPPTPAIACADFGTLAELAVAGGGVALLPTFVAARYVDHGQLVRVLHEVSIGGAPLYLVSAPAARLPARVSALRTFVLSALTRER
jgi:DNA-binding transcriptional LysR family regulator